jgi:hypothetical protein
VGVVAVVVSIDDEFTAGHHKIDADGKEPPFAMMPMGLRDHDAAAGDAVVHPLELVDVVEDRVADRLVDRKIIERHLRLGLHGWKTSVGLKRTNASERTKVVTLAPIGTEDRQQPENRRFCGSRQSAEPPGGFG